MRSTQTDPGPNCAAGLLDRLTGPDRLLKPACLVRRLRPVRLEAISRVLQVDRRRARALALIERWFPEARAGLEDHEDDWLDLMYYFFRLVERANWFEIDWPTLDSLYEHAQQIGYEEDGLEPVPLEYMAEYLWGIPIQTFGFEGREESFERCPPMSLLAQFLGVVDFVDPDFLIDFEIWDNWDDLASGIDGVQQNLANTGHLPEPLCWLPEMAEIATATTGNLLLDNCVDMYDLATGRFGQWDDDQAIDYLKEQYRQAEPRIKMLRQFLDWAEGPEQMQRIANIALYGADHD